MRVAGPAMAVTAFAVAMATATNASGQAACSCTDKDPATTVELQITAATPEDHSRIGAARETLVVDLRGEQTVLVGDAPPFLASVDLAEVPVLMAVAEDATEADECNEVRPPTGSDLSLTGQVYLEDTGPVVWTGPCQGTLTVAEVAPAATTEEDTWGRGLAISTAVLAGLAILCLALVPLTARRRERQASQPPPA